jgi:hypothetical protein
MMADSESRVEASDALGRPAFCLLLIAFLLYNPFFTILSSSADVSVQHPLSYRATVAGSELRRCTMDSAQMLIPGLDASVVHSAPLFMKLHSFNRATLMASYRKHLAIAFGSVRHPPLSP